MNDRPVVLLADVSSWEAWLYLAGALRRQGVEVVRFTGASGSRAQRARVGLERLVFDQTHAVLKTRDGRVDVSAILPWLQRVSDVQMVDAIGDVVTATPQWSQTTRLHRVSAAGISDPSVYDKLFYSRLAHDVGVPVPRIETIGTDFPAGEWVLKGRVGSGGERVAMVDGAADVSDALAAWGLGPDEAFLQARVGGVAWNVGGVARRGDVLVSGAYRAMPADDDPSGPPVQIQIGKRPAQLAAAAALVDALGYSGPFCADFLDDGTPYLLDFNPRFFGSWAAMQSAGVDLLGAYLSLLGRPWSGPRASIETDSIPASVGGAQGMWASFARARKISRRLRPVVGATASAFILADGLARSRR